MELITINDKYSPDTLAFWSKWGVRWPKKDEIVELAEVVKHTTGQIGVRLVRYLDPKVPINHPILGATMMSVSYNIERFRTLSGDAVTKEEIEQAIKEKV